MKSVQGTVALFGLVFAVAGAARADVVDIGVTFRDFRGQGHGGGYEHPDFQPDLVSGGVVHDIVDPMLGADGKPVLNPGRPPNAFVTSEDSFNQWFNDVVDVNVRIEKTLMFDNTITADPRVWTFQDDDFFLLDDQGFGNYPGWDHNYHFTAELHTQFVYDGGDPIQLNYLSDDDLWVYINGQRVIDLGGVRRAGAASFVLDDTSAGELGLVIGQTYDFDLFYAERRTQEAVFHADVLIPAPGSLALLCFGATAVGMRRRRLM